MAQVTSAEPRFPGEPLQDVPGRNGAATHAASHSADKASLSRFEVVSFVLLACLVPLGYTLYTEHIWEDFFITFKYSQNLADGNGLVYNEGERVHGFTSPLGVLLPALCYLVTGSSSYVPALWLFRILSIAAFAGGGLLLLRALKKADPRRAWLAWLSVLLCVLEVKGVAYTINGMETGFLLFFLAWGVALFVDGGPAAWLARGACWAGLMWTRPDGCIYVAGLGLAELLFVRAARKELFLSQLKSAGVCAVLYLPWLLAAWVYYGTPVPHTIVAKSRVEGSTLGFFLDYLQHLPDKVMYVAAQVFRPIYVSEMAGWVGQGALEALAGRLTKAAGVFCAFYWLLPVRDRLGRMLSVCFLVLCLYFCYMYMLFPWYLPPATMLGLLILTRGVVTLTDTVRGWLPQDPLYGHCRWAAYAVLGLFAAWHVVHFGLTSWQMRVQVAQVEVGNRTRIGLWLREHARPTDRVFLEPVGYIGYFSGLRVLDWPGLVSPEVVQVRKKKRLNMATIIPELQPEWVVLRPNELQAVKESAAGRAFESQYTHAATFDVSKSIQEYRFLPGRLYLWIDRTFHVYQRKVASQVVRAGE